MTLGSVTAKNLDLAACYGDSHSEAWPNQVWLALFDGNPASAGTELGSDGGYVRVGIFNDNDNFSVPSGGEITNEVDWVFPAASADYSSTFDYWALMTLETDGEILDCGPIVESDGTTPLTGGPLDPGDQVVFPAGSIVIAA